jgi:hypothetical protein
MVVVGDGTEEHECWLCEAELEAAEFSTGHWLILCNHSTYRVLGATFPLAVRQYLI